MPVLIHQVNVQRIVHIPCNRQVQKKSLPLSLFKKIVAKDQLHLLELKGLQEFLQDLSNVYQFIKGLKIYQIYHY